jgi:hypothetical protein
MSGGTSALGEVAMDHHDGHGAIADAEECESYPFFWAGNWRSPAAATGTTGTSTPFRMV